MVKVKDLNALALLYARNNVRTPTVHLGRVLVPAIGRPMAPAAEPSDFAIHTVALLPVWY